MFVTFSSKQTLLHSAVSLREFREAGSINKVFSQVKSHEKKDKIVALICYISFD